MKTEYSTSNSLELLVLHRTILEAKFRSGAKAEFICSPILSKISLEILDAIKNNCRTRKERESWESWQNIDDTRMEWTVVIDCLQNSDLVEKAGECELIEVIKDMFSPFIVPDDLVKSVICDLLKNA